MGLLAGCVNEYAAWLTQEARENPHRALGNKRCSGL